MEDTGDSRSGPTCAQFRVKNYCGGHGLKCTRVSGCTEGLLCSSLNVARVQSLWISFNYGWLQVLQCGRSICICSTARYGRSRKVMMPRVHQWGRCVVPEATQKHRFLLSLGSLTFSADTSVPICTTRSLSHDRLDVRPIRRTQQDVVHWLFKTGLGLGVGDRVKTALAQENAHASVNNSRACADAAATALLTDKTHGGSSANPDPWTRTDRLQRPCCCSTLRRSKPLLYLTLLRAISVNIKKGNTPSEPDRITYWIGSVQSPRAHHTHSLPAIVSLFTLDASRVEQLSGSCGTRSMYCPDQELTARRSQCEAALSGGRPRRMFCTRRPKVEQTGRTEFCVRSSHGCAAKNAARSSITLWVNALTS